jgi:hypothetical protein
VPEGTEEIWIEVGHGRAFVIEDRQAATYSAACLATRQRRPNRLASDDADERCADGHKGSKDAESYTAACWLVGGHATIQDEVALSARMWFSIC